MKSKIWYGLLGLGILAGLFTAYRVYTVGFTVYAKTDVLVWTLPLSTYIFFSLTSAGLAFVSSIPVVFGIKRYDIIEKRTIYLEIAVLMGSFVCLILHIGSPLQVIYIFFPPTRRHRCGGWPCSTMSTLWSFCVPSGASIPPRSAGLSGL